jgi:hypothetical protein
MMTYIHVDQRKDSMVVGLCFFRHYKREYSKYRDQMQAGDLYITVRQRFA